MPPVPRTTHLIFCALYAALSIFTLVHFLSVSWLGDHGKATHHFDVVYDGEAAMPFAGRVLMPKTIRLIVALTPSALEQAVEGAFAGWRNDREINQALPWFWPSFPPRSPAYPRLVAVILVYACLIGFIVMFYRLAQALFPQEAMIAYLAPVFGMLAISALSSPMQYMYDFSLLFFSAGCYYFILTKQWKHYAAFFLLATLNRETSVFLLLFFTLWEYRRMEKTTYVHYLSLQIAAYLIVRVAIAAIYQDNAQWFAGRMLFFPVFNSLLGRGQPGEMIVLAGLFLLLGYRWQEKPAFLKTGLWVWLAMVPVFLVYGYPHEYRVFFDVLPLLTLLATHTLVSLVRKEDKV
jgi:hypothetical protein